MINISEKSECCGCSACKSICPKKCIEMKEDEEGFLYPKVDIKTCVKCGLCEKVCPILHKEEIRPFEQKGYIVQNTDETILRESTAGGAFTAIAEYVISLGGVVLGVTLDEELNAKHISVDSIQDLRLFRNSKYIESNVNSAYAKVKCLLEQDKYVCFSGTPCQIEGLMSYLRGRYEKLVTVDVVCRAVPSPLIFRKYIEYQEKRNKSKVKYIRFRDKYYGYKFSTINILTNKNKGNYHKGVESDPWLRAFFSNICNRPSCYKCRFRSRYRVSDFTIWDCFNVGRFSKELDNDRGATRILIHTNKGVDIFEKITSKLKYVQVDPEVLTDKVSELKKSPIINERREDFFKDAIYLGGEELFQRYFPNTIKVVFKRMSRMLCYRLGIYSIVKKLYVRVTNKY